MHIIDLQILNRLAAQAGNAPRRRMNHNLHQSYADPCQRLLNAVEPDSYIRPHRHLTPPKGETFLVLRGCFAALIFGEDGAIERALRLDAAGETLGVDIPAGAWHTILSLAPGSIFFEAKPGPYEPISDKDWAPWAPAEGSPEATEYLAKLRGMILTP